MPLSRYDGAVLDAVSRPVPGAFVAVLTQPADTSHQPGAPLANIFADPSGAVPLANPLQVSGRGDYAFYIAPGVYTLQIYGGGLYEPIVLADQNILPVGVGSTGVLIETGGVINSNQNLLNLVAGANISLNESGGAVTISAATAAPTLKTGGSTNSVQNLLNLLAGAGISLAESAGTITITALASGTRYVDGEIPAGTQDGTNPVFTLAFTPNPAQSLQLFVNGTLLQQGVGYNLAGNVISYSAGYIPQPAGADPADIQLAYYRL